MLWQCIALPVVPPAVIMIMRRDPDPWRVASLPRAPRWPVVGVVVFTPLHPSCGGNVARVEVEARRAPAAPECARAQRSAGHGVCQTLGLSACLRVRPQPAVHRSRPAVAASGHSNACAQRGHGHGQCRAGKLDTSSSCSTHAHCIAAVLARKRPLCVCADARHAATLRYCCARQARDQMSVWSHCGVRGRGTPRTGCAGPL